VKLFRLPGVHRPVSDTWMLAEAMRHESLEGARVADLCAGTGALAICAAQWGAASVVAVDLTPRAAITARINARLHGANVRVVRGDLFTPLKGESFDIIVSNPPYIPAESDQLPRHGSKVPLDAGRDGRALLDRICHEAPRHLRPGGVILLVHSSICGDEQTCRILRACGLEAEIIVRRRGVLGPVMSARASMLRARGLLGPGDEEDIVVVRGTLPRRPDLYSGIGEYVRIDR
jgi:release factor glutamine methyltransferase